MTEQLVPEQPTNPEILKENPVIVVDIDGVLFDTPQHAVERWNDSNQISHGEHMQKTWSRQKRLVKTGQNCGHAH